MATSITNKGNALLAKLTQGIDLQITSVKSGAGTVDASLLQEQTGVTNVKQELTIKGVSFPEPGTCALVLDLNNNGLAAGYTLTQIGIYAQDPDEGEILFSIWQVDDAGVTIHSEAVLPGYNAEWNYNIIFDQADSVIVNVDPTNTVSQAAMEAYIDMRLGNVDNTPDNDKNVAFAVRAGEADKTKYAITVRLNGGRTEGSNQFTFDGSTSKSLNITPAKIGAAEEEHTHDYAGSDTPGGAATTATKLATARTFQTNLRSASAASFDGSENVTPGVTGILSVENGGTGSSTPKGARFNLEVASIEELPNLHIWKTYAGEPNQIAEGEPTDNHTFRFAIRYSGALAVKDNTISLYYPDESAISELYDGNPENMGLAIAEANDLLRGQYLQDPKDGSIWYFGDSSSCDFSSGATLIVSGCASITIAESSARVGFGIAKKRATYPDNGTHTDGLWYVYHKQLGD